MGWLDKLLGREPEGGDTGQPDDIRFGRYSDNNKSLHKTRRWYDAEDAFKEKKYVDSFRAFFDYLEDDEVKNVEFRQQGDRFSFEFFQGSKIVRGECDGSRVLAKVSLARMPQPGAAVMRHMLELNYSLFYSRAALDGDLLYMCFDSDMQSANPNKLYYGLKELATKADRQDDMLVADFRALEQVDVQHVMPLSSRELDVKFRYFRKWIEEGLQRIDQLNKDSFSGAISYLLLTILYRIDYLIAPEAKLLTDLEKINGIYWSKREELPVVERNQRMQDEFRKLLDWSKEDFEKNVYRTKATFAITNPPKPEKLKETIENSNQDSRWYIDNKYPDLAVVLTEYGLSYNQFSFSQPAVLSELFELFMRVLHPGFFDELGRQKMLYRPDSRQFAKGDIQQRIQQIVSRHKEKHPYLSFAVERLNFESLYSFTISYSQQVAMLNLDLQPRK